MQTKLNLKVDLILKLNQSVKLFPIQSVKLLFFLCSHIGWLVKKGEESGLYKKGEMALENIFTWTGSMADQDGS